MRFLLLLFVLAASLHAAVINITIIGTTPTQVVAKYTSTIPGPCTLAVSESAGLTPLVNDVNPALFPGSNSDQRGFPNPTGNLGSVRTVIVGQRATGNDVTGTSYSRALQAFTRHYMQVTCGADIGTATFWTKNPPLGNNAPEVPLFDATAFGNYAMPTIDFSPAGKDKSYVEPLTGILFKRATSPSDTTDASSQNVAFSAVIDQAGVWTTPGNIILNGPGVATYGGTGMSAAALFLVAPIGPVGNHGYTAESLVVDARFKITGLGTDATAANRTLSACISQDHGQTCQGATIDLPALPTVTAAVVFFPPAYPNPIFQQWVTPPGKPPITPNIWTRSGNVTISGTTLTLNSGDTLQDLVPGDVLTVPGSGCPNGDQCVIATVVNAYKVTLTTSASITANYTANNFGWKVWKKTATGSVSVNTAHFDPVWDVHLKMPAEGSYSQCNTNYANTTVDRNGTALGYTQPGFLCVQQQIWGNTNLYWHGTNGEGRFIAQLVRPNVSNPVVDSVVPGQYLCIQSGGSGQMNPFDPTDPNVLYCVGTKTGSPAQFDVIYKCTYTGNYAEWTDWTQENPGMSCVNITKKSLNKDLQSQGLPSGLVIAAGNQAGPYMGFAAFYVAQDNRGFYVRFNLTTSLMEYVRDTWSNLTGPRWGVMHGGASIGNSVGSVYTTGMRNQTPSTGMYQVPLTAIRGLANTALTAVYTDTQTCQQMGVTDPGFIAAGASGNNCIQVTVTSEPYWLTPDTPTYTAFPWPKNSTACFGDNSTANCWAQLQTAIEGDFVYDVTDNGLSQGSANGYWEQFKIVKKVNATTWILQRGASQADCSVIPQGKNVHINGWVPIMIPRGLCSAASYYFDNITNAVSIDTSSMTTSHGDLLTTDGVGNSGIYVQSGYDMRVGNLVANIGQPATFHSVAEYQPQFAGSPNSLSPFLVQSHPSGKQLKAQPSELRWILDGRPIAGASGGGNVLYHVIASTAVQGVYKVGPPTDGPNGTGNVLSVLDRKNLPLHVWAGRYLLKDKSGPGSVLAAGDLWNYCVADFAGECIAGSAAGDVYMNVPQAALDFLGTTTILDTQTCGSILLRTCGQTQTATPKTDFIGLCASQLEVNTLCWVSANPITPFITQAGVDRPDATGLYWRRISMWFNGIGWPDGFWNARALPDASWAFSNMIWGNGVRTEIMMAKLPPWPAVDTINRSTFVPVQVQFTSLQSESFKIIFGYDTNLRCTSRAEQCATMASPTQASPFQWLSENKPGVLCGQLALCKLTIPALSGHVLYYVITGDNGTTYPMAVQPVD